MNSNSSRNYGWPIFLYDGTFSFKSHFRHQIFANAWEKIVNKKEQIQDKGNDKGNPLESAHYIVARCTLGIEEAFSTSISWNDIWLSDVGATCHMTFRKYFFETFNDQINGVVHLEN